jgi:hypothetical protein
LWKHRLSLVYLLEGKRTLICTFDLPRCLRPPCHPGPAQLNPYKPVSSNRNAAYSQYPLRFEAEYIGQKGDGHRLPQLAIRVGLAHLPLSFEPVVLHPRGPVRPLAPTSAKPPTASKATRIKKGCNHNQSDKTDLAASRSPHGARKRKADP